MTPAAAPVPLSLTSVTPAQTVGENAELPSPALPSSRSSATPRLHFVDGARALAMLSVVFYHAWLWGGKWPLRIGVGGHGVPLAYILFLGHAGVNLFLVLSGFCLFWPFALNPTRAFEVKTFAFRRCWRVLPPYYGSLLFSTLLVLVPALLDGDQAKAIHTGKSFAAHALMLHNFNAGYVVDINGAMWSLALEFQLYFFFPLFLSLMRKTTARHVMYGALVLCALVRFVLAKYAPSGLSVEQGFVLYYGVWGRFFEFVVGMFAAQMVADGHKTGRLPLLKTDYLLAGVVAILALWTFRGTAANSGGEFWFRPMTDIFFGTASAIFLLVASRPQSLVHRLFSARWFAHLGVMSYSIYLVHEVIIELITGRITRSLPGVSGTTKMMVLDLLVVVPIVLLFGWLFHVLIERHFLFPPGKKPSSTTLPVAAGTV